ncbi:ABC transporter permease [Thermoactinomyces sp. DSM 45892]|uniref:ABC transporter permease n=1 Tax=Thermoactinomyces sp. DSM 45892 TaxID=1882753 RepID=UPI0008985146|nr:ABC transporter permease [Thermoactinomyces sp. DSM 45892]SDY48514.1 nucleoside ABC transporter membrane protein [Thermoactinomyces sp. DSM 45892]
MIGKLNRNSTLFSSIISIVLGMLVGAIAMLLSGYNPISAYGALFNSVFGSASDMGETLRTITPLIFAGLAVALAFRTGMFNIGVEGQLIIGSMAAAFVGLKLELPPVVHAIVALVVGALAGAIWALIPGLLKAIRGVHEVIVCIMMNWIALFLSNYMVGKVLSNNSDSTEKIHPSASIRVDFLTDLFDGARVHLGLILAILTAIFVYVLLFKTKLGYELRAVGLNPDASEYAGMSVKRNIIFSMMISGGIAGLAGAVELLGTSEYLSINASLPGTGFDGIAVALLGANTPLGVVMSSMLFGGLFNGGSNMQYVAGVPFEVIRIVFAAIILFVAANFVKQLGSRKNRKKKGEKASA